MLGEIPQDEGKKQTLKKEVADLMSEWSRVNADDLRALNDQQKSSPLKRRPTSKSLHEGGTESSGEESSGENEDPDEPAEKPARRTARPGKKPRLSDEKNKGPRDAGQSDFRRARSSATLGDEDLFGGPFTSAVAAEDFVLSSCLLHAISQLSAVPSRRAPRSRTRYSWSRRRRYASVTYVVQSKSPIP